MVTYVMRQQVCQRDAIASTGTASCPTRIGIADRRWPTGWWPGRHSGSAGVAGLHEELCSRQYLHVAETTLRVLHKQKRASEKDSYIWLYRSGRDGAPVVIFSTSKQRNLKYIILTRLLFTSLSLL
ncbi:IS66 family transposase [Alicyclobacillus hesperidum]|uniref:IS66 family transposase n=1 Tax=Alicyclobacillus hesperidum TaxID=89784 RepID=UPI0036F1D77C